MRIKQFTTSSSSAARDAHCAAYRRTHREQGGIARADRAKRGHKVSRKRRVKVRVRCPEIIRDCRGRLALMRGRRTLARTTLPVDPRGAKPRRWSRSPSLDSTARPRDATRRSG